MQKIPGAANVPSVYISRELIDAPMTRVKGSQKNVRWDANI